MSRLLNVCLLVILVGACGDDSPKKKGAATNPGVTDTGQQNPDQGVSDAGHLGDEGLPDLPDEGLPDLPPNDDPDNDGRPNSNDNCPMIANPTQADVDFDGVGDACDNCVPTANKNQRDANGNGVGDACEEPTYDPTRDSDNDGIPDINDKCPLAVGTADQDNDGIPDVCDNCPTVPNPDQKDANTNGIGDACDAAPSGMECPRTITALEPALHIILDGSGSMIDSTGGVQRWRIQRNGINAVANRLANQFVVGASVFGASGSSCSVSNVLSMQKWPAATIETIAPTNVNGSSNSSAALQDAENRFVSPNDSSFDQRERHVLLIADGQGNTCTPPSDTSAAQALAQSTGASVHVIALQNGTPISSAVAQNGTYTFVDSESGFNTAMTNALDAMESCSLAVSAPPEDPNLLWVLRNGTPLDRAAYAYDPATEAIKLSPAACAQGLQGLTLFAGCAAVCTVSEEICDYKDNNCDGRVDEGCGVCVPEICNNKDDDCDGEVDEGC